jgi:cell division protein ZapA (FtsZ GTPase activity inhibitor)
MDFQNVIKELQDTLVVVSEIQRRQAEVQKLQALESDAMRERIQRHEEWLAHMQQTLEEAGDKLNGLIGYLGDLRRDKSE